MNFMDEDTRDRFHQDVNSLTQMICHMFESFCYQHGMQAEVIDLDNEEVIMGAPEADSATASAICSKINIQFKRKDTGKVCKLHNLDYGLFSIMFTTIDELKDYN